MTAHDGHLARPAEPLGRVAILHQGCIPTYREGFFELLNRAGQIEYTVFHGAAPAGSGLEEARGPFSFPNVRVKNRAVPVLGRTVVWQPVLRQLVMGGFDAVVLGHEMRFLANNLAFLSFKAAGRPVLLWGHGKEIATDVTGLAKLPRALAVAAKRVSARHANGYLVYTEGGRVRLVRDGVRPERISVLRNTIDTARERALAQQCRAFPELTLRSDLGLLPDSTVLAFLGRLYSEKRVHELPTAVSMAMARGWVEGPVEVVVIGEGPDLAGLRKRFGNLGWVHFPGARRGLDAAKYLRLAAAVVIPGKVGLAVNHAFAHGVPLVTRAGDLHAPEVEYVEDGRNGLIVNGNDIDFAKALASLVRDCHLQQRLARGAGETSDSLQLHDMVTCFDRAVRRALNLGEDL